MKSTFADFLEAQPPAMLYALWRGAEPLGRAGRPGPIGEGQIGFGPPPFLFPLHTPLARYSVFTCAALATADHFFISSTR